MKNKQKGHKMDIKVIFAMTMFIGMYGLLDGAGIGTAVPTLHPPTSAPSICMMGTCNAIACKNGTSYYPVQCITHINLCVTEIVVPTSGVKQYNFRCATKTCDLEKKGAPANITDILCCNTSQCNTYTVAQTYTTPTPTTSSTTTPVTSPKTTPVISPKTTPAKSPKTSPINSANNTSINSHKDSGASRWHSNNISVVFGFLAWLLIVIQ